MDSSIGNTPPEFNDKSLALFSTARERLTFYRQEIHQEISSLAQRTNAFFTAQSFMVIAYCSAMNNTNPHWGDLYTLYIPVLLTIFGVFNCVNSYIEISSVYRALDHWQDKQDCLLNSDIVIGQAFDERPLFTQQYYANKAHRYSIFFSRRSTILLALLWLVLGGITLYFHFW
ncbi:hypothetical protein SAMN05216522_103208 [Rosenbergiella nectarea]|uniref:Uncharacterized protein n=1 Tax=Rosenbergiella nectarea TaxID=988801 RepID=A0A1H9GGS6_9GAMM|nr:hypothetical protein [Rosenbergiella nectarea]SEQ49266.1 hypothetical protein SAMN05216522_103208 [Rosenbergiella nectarea]